MLAFALALVVQVEGVESSGSWLPPVPHWTNTWGGVGGSGPIALGDLDGDGWGEFVTQTYFPPQPDIVVFENFGDDDYREVFKGKSAFAVGKITTIATGDTDGDGLMEVVAGTVTGKILIWENTGDDQFIELDSGIKKALTRQLRICDSDGDGLQEIAIIADNNAGILPTFWLFEHAGVTGVNKYVTRLKQPISVGLNFAVGDSDGDGLFEFVFTNGFLNGPMAVERVENKGDNSYAYSLFPLGTGVLRHPLIADVDGDGMAELIAGVHTPNGSGLRIYKSPADDTYVLAYEDLVAGSVGRGVGHVMTIDTACGGSRPSILLGLRSPVGLQTPEEVFTWARRGVSWSRLYRQTFPVILRPGAVAAGDLDRDGRLELFVPPPPDIPNPGSIVAFESSLTCRPGASSPPP